MADLTQFRQGAQNFYSGLTFNQKLTIGGTLILTILGFILLFRWATRPDYALLFSSLDLKEADQIVESLKGQGVSYRLTSGGTSILIPSKDVYEWRMKLASQGLPSSGGIGYEIFDKKDIGISDFVQEVNYRRALEGELVRSIRSITGIQNARVHIVMPKSRLFKEEQQEPTASIVLNVRPGMRISESQIVGITNLVAAGVEGLLPEKVTIVDSNGRILTSRWESDSVMGMTGRQLEMQKKVESYLENKAQSMLATVLGGGRTVVRVSADLNFQRIERTNEIYDPDNLAVVSEERNEESNTDSLGKPYGRMEHSITNYHVPKTVEHVTNTVGNIRRLSVAVLVDGIRKKVVDENGEERWEYQPRPSNEMALLSAVVRNAVGYDPMRGDQLEIRNIPFDGEQVPEDQKDMVSTSRKEFWFSIGQKVLAGLFLLFLLLVLRSKLRKVKVTLPPVSTVAKERPIGISLEETPIPRIDDTVPPEALESAKLLKQISVFAEEKPSLAARLLRYWLVEE